VRVAPYINGRIFDTGTATWTKDKAAAFAAKFVTPAVDDPKLQLYTESYGSGATFAVRPCFPCHGSRLGCTHSLIDRLMTTTTGDVPGDVVLAGQDRRRGGHAGEQLRRGRSL
jgi:hypothetical protein